MLDTWKYLGQIVVEYILIFKYSSHDHTLLQDPKNVFGIMIESPPAQS